MKAKNKKKETAMKTRPATRVKAEYRRAKFSSFTQEQIEIAARELRKIEDEDGEVRPARILELAASPDHPLHALIFQDDPEVAAQKWYLDRARRLCRAVRIVYVDDDGKDVAEAPMLASVPIATVEDDEETGGVQIRTRRYISIERAFSDPAVCDAMLKEALAQADAWRSRYSHLKSLRPVFSAICAVQRSVAGARR